MTLNFSEYLRSGECAALQFFQQYCYTLADDDLLIDIAGMDGMHFGWSSPLWDFSWILADCYIQRLVPEYIQGQDDYNLYMAWTCAAEDLRLQRELDLAIAHFLIIPYLEDGYYTIGGAWDIPDDLRQSVIRNGEMHREEILEAKRSRDTDQVLKLLCGVQPMEQFSVMDYLLDL